MIRDLVIHIVTSLVDNTAAVTVTETEKSGRPTLEVRVAAGDVGKVIGREGRTFRALRTLVQLLDGPSPRDITVDNLDA